FAGRRGMTIPLARSRPMRSDPEAPRPPLPDDDGGLVAAARAGNREAAERLAETTYSRLWAGCLRMTGDGDAAADLVQETYRKAWQSLASFRGDAQFST